MKTSSKLLAGLLATGIALPALAQTAQPAPPPPPPAADKTARRVTDAVSYTHLTLPTTPYV